MVHDFSVLTGVQQGLRGYNPYVRRTSLRYVSILFFIHLYIKINKDWVMVLDSSGQDAQDFKKSKNFQKSPSFKKTF